MWEQIVGYFWNPHFQSSVVILHSLDVNDDLSRHAECMAIKTAIIGINQNHLPPLPTKRISIVVDEVANVNTKTSQNLLPPNLFWRGTWVSSFAFICSRSKFNFPSQILSIQILFQKANGISKFEKSLNLNHVRITSLLDNNCLLVP